MELIQNPNRELWWDVAKECPYATFFHTPLWADIAMVQPDTKGNHTIAAKLSNGTTAVLPLIGMRPGGNRVGRRLRSTYAGSYGGVIADGPLNSEINELYKIIKNWKTLECKIVESPIVDREFDPFNINCISKNTKSDFTQIIPLNRESSKIIEEFSKTRRRGIRKSKKKGVAVREATDLGDYERYFGAYQESLNRWEDVSIQYGWDTFKKIYELSCNFPDCVKLWVTDIDGSIASGAVVFYWNGHSAYWHGASYSEYFDYYINDRIHTDIINDAIDRGLEYYDLLPSGGNEGVVKFKSQFGPEKRDIQRWTYETSSFQFARHIKDRVSSYRLNEHTDTEEK